MTCMATGMPYRSHNFSCQSFRRMVHSPAQDIHIARIAPSPSLRTLRFESPSSGTNASWILGRSKATVARITYAWHSVSLKDALVVISMTFSRSMQVHGTWTRSRSGELRCSYVISPVSSTASSQEESSRSMSLRMSFADMARRCCPPNPIMSTIGRHDEMFQSPLAGSKL